MAGNGGSHPAAYPAPSHARRDAPRRVDANPPTNGPENPRPDPLPAQNALKVKVVRVRSIPGIPLKQSSTKRPISLPSGG